MTILDDVKALGYGSVRGGAGIADFLGSVLTAPARDMIRLNEALNESAKGNKEPLQKYKDRGVLNFLGDTFGGFDLATQAAAKAGLLNTPQNKREAYIQSIGEMIPGVATGGGGLLRKGITAVGGGIGAQSLGDAASLIDPSYETPGRIAGALLGGAPGVAYKNPSLFERTIKPDLTDKEIGIMKALEKKPGYAPYFAEKIKADDASLLKEFQKTISKVSKTKADTNKDVLSLLKGKEVDTNPIIAFLQQHINDVEGTVTGSGGESANYARQMIARLQNQKDPYALHKLKQEVGRFTQDMNAPSISKEGIARPLYGQLSEVLEQTFPGYRQIMTTGNQARQASELNTELLNAQARSKGDPAQALKRFSERVIQKEIKNELDGVTPEIDNILSKAEDYGTQFAERGGSGAKIAQKAAEDQATYGFRVTQVPNYLVGGELVDPIRNVSNFMKVTQGKNPYLSPETGGMVVGASQSPEGQQPEVLSSAPMQPIPQMDYSRPQFESHSFDDFLGSANSNNDGSENAFDQFLKAGRKR